MTFWRRGPPRARGPASRKSFEHPETFVNLLKGEARRNDNGKQIKNFENQIELQSSLSNDNQAQNLIEEADLVVNTTPVGMQIAKPEMNLLPYGESFWRSLNSKTIVYDLIYNPAPTHLLKFSANKGCMTIDGLQMLVAQGLKSLSFWTNGLEVPFHVMNEALKNYL